MELPDVNSLAQNGWDHCHWDLEKIIVCPALVTVGEVDEISCKSS